MIFPEKYIIVKKLLVIKTMRKVKTVIKVKTVRKAKTMNLSGKRQRKAPILLSVPVATEDVQVVQPAKMNMIWMSKNRKRVQSRRNNPDKDPSRKKPPKTNPTMSIQKVDQVKRNEDITRDPVSSS